MQSNKDCANHQLCAKATSPEFWRSAGWLLTCSYSFFFLRGIKPITAVIVFSQPRQWRTTSEVVIRLLANLTLELCWCRLWRWSTLHSCLNNYEYWLFPEISIPIAFYTMPHTRSNLFLWLSSYCNTTTPTDTLSMAKLLGVLVSKQLESLRLETTLFLEKLDDNHFVL